MPRAALMAMMMPLSIAISRTAVITWQLRQIDVAGDIAGRGAMMMPDFLSIDAPMTRMAARRPLI